MWVRVGKLCTLEPPFLGWADLTFLSPAMAKPLGGGGGHRNARRPSVTKLCWCDNFRFHGPIYTIFDPVMHPTIALDEFEDE